MKRWIVISLIILLIAIVISAVIYLNKGDVGFSPKELPECNTLSFNGENKINLVFLSDKDNAKLYSDALLSFSPFRENKNSFNFYYIDSYFPECTLYKDVALYCYSKDLVKKASACPNDYVVAVKKEKPEIRSSAYMNILSINSNHQTSVLLHEFGHTFANLAEEYIPATLPRKQKNCLQDCTNLPGGSCFQGCSRTDYFRSIERGIMRSLGAKTYGAFNEQLILDRLKSAEQAKITGQAINEEINCEKERYYLIEGNYSNRNIEFISKSIEQGCIGTSGSGAFDYSITLEDNSQIQLGEFNAELIFTDLPGEQNADITGQTFENEGNFYLKIPIIEKAKSLEIATPEDKLSISLGDTKYTPCKIE